MNVIYRSDINNFYNTIGTPKDPVAFLKSRNFSSIKESLDMGEVARQYSDISGCFVELTTKQLNACENVFSPYFDHLIEVDFSKMLSLIELPHWITRIPLLQTLILHPRQLQSFSHIVYELPQLEYVVITYPKNEIPESLKLLGEETIGFLTIDHGLNDEIKTRPDYFDSSIERRIVFYRNPFSDCIRQITSQSVYVRKQLISEVFTSIEKQTLKCLQVVQNDSSIQITQVKLRLWCPLQQELKEAICQLESLKVLDVDIIDQNHIPLVIEILQRAEKLLVCCCRIRFEDSEKLMNALRDASKCYQYQSVERAEDFAPFSRYAIQKKNSPYIFKIKDRSWIHWNFVDQISFIMKQCIRRIALFFHLISEKKQPPEIVMKAQPFTACSEAV